MTQASLHNPVPPTTPDNNAHRGAWIWPAIVIGLLSLQVVICTVAFFVATADPSQVVVSNYHAKALAWDEQRAEQRAVAELGWQAALDISPEADMLGDRTVRLTLKDAQGEPLTGATVSASTYHFARANQLIEADLAEAAPGEYVARMNMRKPGRWSLTLDVTHGEDHYPITLEQQVGSTGWVPR